MNPHAAAKLARKARHSSPSRRWRMWLRDLRARAEWHAKARAWLWAKTRAMTRAKSLAKLKAKTQAGAAWKQAGRCRREAVAWARRLRRCPSRVPFSAGSARLVFRWVPGRSRTGISRGHQRCSNPTCRSGRHDNIRRAPAPTEFPKCVREWALSDRTGGGNGGGAESFSFSPRRWNSIAAAGANIGQDACRGEYARKIGRRCARCVCCAWRDSGLAHERFSGRNAKTCVKSSGARER